MPFAILVEVNHHIQSILFGCGLIFNKILRYLYSYFNLDLQECLVMLQLQWLLIKIRPCKMQFKLYFLVHDTYVVYNI